MFSRPLPNFAIVPAEARLQLVATISGSPHPRACPVLEQSVRQITFKYVWNLESVWNPWNSCQLQSNAYEQCQSRKHRFRVHIKLDHSQLFTVTQTSKMSLGYDEIYNILKFVPSETLSPLSDGDDLLGEISKRLLAQTMDIQIVVPTYNNNSTPSVYFKKVYQDSMQKPKMELIDNVSENLWNRVRTVKVILSKMKWLLKKPKEMDVLMSRGSIHCENLVIEDGANTEISGALKSLSGVLTCDKLFLTGPNTQGKLYGSFRRDRAPILYNLSNFSPKQLHVNGSDLLSAAELLEFVNKGEWSVVETNLRMESSELRRMIDFWMNNETDFVSFKCDCCADEFFVQAGVNHNQHNEKKLLLEFAHLLNSKKATLWTSNHGSVVEIKFQV
ncbi:hypothetical protein L596_025131 [Steinernema carpocapsae]|uniref:Uncharacterized protein n=1 Tax=Steinernema carpocapsae TaxID=34508 RepID=A0A4U5M6Z2_STECR|nr:hypothetical protein L596_025131 [Steinernema carpocapsae]